MSDLARAHVLAIDALADRPELVLNLGTGTGSSNREVAEMVQRVTGQSFEVRYVERRPGDPAAAIASNERARDVLGWKPEHSSLDNIVADAWSAWQAM